MSDYVVVYVLRALAVLNSEGADKDLFARWIEPGPDSEEVRKKILVDIRERAGAVRLKKVNLRVEAVCRPDLAPDNCLELSAPLPSARAQVIVTFHPKNEADLKRCFDFEVALEKELEGSEFGYVDGNDIGGGEFRIFCLGPKKTPLKEAVNANRTKFGM